jgi:hypothetical protein
LLTTTGARTANSFANSGAPSHPDWFRNLIVN